MLSDIVCDVCKEWEQGTHTWYKVMEQKLVDLVDSRFHPAIVYLNANERVSLGYIRLVWRLGIVEKEKLDWVLYETHNRLTKWLRNMVYKGWLTECGSTIYLNMSNQLGLPDTLQLKDGSQIIDFGGKV